MISGSAACAGASSSPFVDSRNRNHDASDREVLAVTAPRTHRTQASPRTGLTPAGHRELVAPTSCGPPFPHNAGAVPAHSGIAATRFDGSSVAASRPTAATSRSRVRRRSAVEISPTRTVSLALPEPDGCYRARRTAGHASRPARPLPVVVVLGLPGHSTHRSSRLERRACCAGGVKRRCGVVEFRTIKCALGVWVREARDAVRSQTASPPNLRGDLRRRPSRGLHPGGQ